MTETIDIITFTAALTAALTVAVKAHPAKTPIFVRPDGKGWTSDSRFDGFLPVDPTGDLFHDFVVERGTVKVTKKAAGAFVRRNAESLYNDFIGRLKAAQEAAAPAEQEEEPATEPEGEEAAEEAAAAADIAPAEDAPAVDGPVADNADVEPVVTDTEQAGEDEASGEDEAERPEEEPAAEQEDEQAAPVAAAEVQAESLAPAEQPKRRGPQAAPRVTFAPGAVNLRSYKGQVYEVRILADGKRCTVDGQEFSSLSTAALQMFELHVSGVKFWGFVR